MADTTPLIRIADMSMLVTGGAAVLAIMVVLSVRRRWADAARLPRPTDNNVEAIDLLIGLAALLFLPGVFKRFLDLMAGTIPTTQPEAEALPTPQAAMANIAGQIGATAVLILLGRLRFAGGLAGWGLRLAGWPRQLLTAVIAYVAIWPLCSGLLELTVFGIRLVFRNYTPPEHNTIRLLQAGNEPRWLCGMIIVSALILAPVVEELFFRGLLQSAVAKWSGSQWRSVIFCGCAFGLFHFSVEQTIPALALLGIVLGYCYARTRSLTLVIFLHAVFNGKTLLWLMLSQ
ncbi:MAG TPA: CPBP family intramembrane glutamic endopeptidase [Phycisphaerae bacterium]|nr:CPBP family intramembrane glutamic endopeptidase [Phycisphaerae bacterium]